MSEHPAGDPIEVAALASALSVPSSRGPRRMAPPALLSSKACFGHTEGAAGLTGVFEIRLAVP